MRPVDGQHYIFCGCELRPGTGDTKALCELHKYYLFGLAAAPVAERPADTHENPPNSCSEPTNRPASVAKDTPSPDPPPTATGAHD
jgi:hypothetical protein